MAAPHDLSRLVHRFSAHYESYKSPSYNETQVRREFIDPLFKLLGWDVDGAGDSRAQMLMYTYLDTELSFYEDFLENGNPFIATFMQHEYFLKKDGEFLSEISEFIHSTNDGTIIYKQDVADRLERIEYMSHNNAPKQTQ